MNRKNLRVFTQQLDCPCSGFERRVLRILKKIWCGKTVSFNIMMLRIHYIKDKSEDLAVQNKYASTLLNN